MKWQLRLCSQLWIVLLMCFFTASPVLSMGKNKQMKCCKITPSEHDCCCSGGEQQDTPSTKGCENQHCMMISASSSVQGCVVAAIQLLPSPKFLFETKQQMLHVDEKILNGSHFSVWQPPQL